MSDSPIGLIGVGLLGTALAERMIGGGLTLVGFDPRLEQLARLEQLGGRLGGRAAEIAAACQTIVLALPDSAVVAAALGQIGNRLRSGILLIDSTTGDPDESTQLAADLRSRGVGYVDATLAGSSEQVRRGAATV